MFSFILAPASFKIAPAVQPLLFYGLALVVLYKIMF